MHQLLWVRPFSGMRTTVIVAAMLVEQLELFPPLITIGNRMSHPPGELFALWPPLPLNPYWYNTDRAHSYAGVAVAGVSGV